MSERVHWEVVMSSVKYTSRESACFSSCSVRLCFKLSGHQVAGPIGVI